MAFPKLHLWGYPKADTCGELPAPMKRRLLQLVAAICKYKYLVLTPGANSVFFFPREITGGDVQDVQDVQCMCKACAVHDDGAIGVLPSDPKIRHTRQLMCKSATTNCCTLGCAYTKLSGKPTHQASRKLQQLQSQAYPRRV